MPLGKLKPDYTPLPQIRAPLTANIDGLAAVPSPVRSLQEQLELRATQALPVVEKWSPRHAISFIVAASAALWMALIVAAAQVAHAVT